MIETLLGIRERMAFMAELTLEQHKRLVEQLGGPEQSLKLLSCSQATVEFPDVATAVVRAVSPRLSIWQSIQVGGIYPTYSSYLDAILKNQVNVSAVVRNSLERLSPLSVVTEATLQLVACSASDFGFRIGADYETIRARATSLGFGLCPVSVALALCAEHKEKVSPSEPLAIFTEPLLDDQGTPYILDVLWNKEEFFLLPQYTYSECIWLPVHHLVFVAPSWLTA